MRKVSRKATRFCRDVRKAIADESAAIRFYRRVANEAPTSRARRIVRQIRQDEISHRRLFRRLRRDLCN